MNNPNSRKQQKKVKVPSQQNIKKKVSSRLSGIGPIVSAPTSYSRVMYGSQPLFSKSSRSDSIRVSHREYLTDVRGNAGGTFNLVSYNLNPGLQNVFKWLSSIAADFESYKFLRLDVCYEPMCATTQGGSVLMAIDFDSTDLPPTTRQDMQSFSTSTRSPAWHESSLSCRPSDLIKGAPTKYVRFGSIPANQDQRLYDVGNLMIATDLIVNGTLGEVYLLYEIEFQTPATNAVAVVTAGSLISTAATGVALATPFGTAPVNGGGLPFIFDSQGRGFQILRSGTFLLSFYITGTVITAVPTYTINGVFGGGNDPSYGSVKVDEAIIINAATTVAYHNISIISLKPYCTVTITYAGSATTLTNLVMRAANYDPTL